MTRRPARALSIVCFALGAAVFLARVHHPGPYAFPEQGNLRAALGAIALGVWFARPWVVGFSLRRPLEVAVVALTPVVLFFALYATFAELEEVVVLETFDREGQPASLRLWVMDADGAEWVNMSSSKASAHGLGDAQVELLRGGEWSCRRAVRVDDRETVARIGRLGSEKYAVKRLATAIGLFGETPSAETVSIRLDPCDDDGGNAAEGVGRAR